MRIAIGVGVGASCLLGCSGGGVLDVGSSDAGDPPEASPEASLGVTVFSAAAVEKARKLCASPSARLPWTAYTPPASLRYDLTGGWLLCNYYAPIPKDARSVQFLDDGHWYTLGDDGDGGLARVSLGDQAGPFGSEGTYTFLDGTADAAAPDASAVYVAVNGMLWFHPEFKWIGAGYLMTADFDANGQHDNCVRIDSP